MMKSASHSVRAAFACLALLMPQAAHAARPAQTETIAAVVNDDAVSVSDVSERMKLIMVSSGIPDSPEMREKMAPQIVNSLIDERLMMQEAARLGIEVTQPEIEQGFHSIAQQNNMTGEQFLQVLRRSGLDTRTMAAQIRAQLAWSKVITAALRPQVEITDGQIDAALARLAAEQGKPQYLVAEIFLPVETPDQDGNVRQLAEKLVKEMREKRVPFQRVASQFSQAAGAAQGGDLGWVREGQLAPEVEAELAKMQPPGLSDPVRSTLGYHLLLLREKNVLSAENMPSRDEMRKRIGIQQLERLQRRHLLDLKSAAFIERRA